MGRSGAVSGGLIVGLAAAWVLGPVSSGFADAPESWKSARWDWRAGYAYQYTNTSRPTHFQMIELLPSARVPMTDPIGPAWFRGRLEWNPELWLGLFTHPYTRPLVGATPIQFHWEWETPCRWKPYFMAGTGILYANVNRRETRQDLNFNLQAGFGTYFHFSDSSALLLEYRHVHISNAGLHEDNAGVNHHTFLAGLSIKK